jgi:Holliday junction DNA helicase RuvA
MIRQLRGTVSDRTEKSVVIDVQGVGYLVRTTAPGTLFPIESEITLHTYLAVRETALDLYGFQTLDELDVFELLLTLPKIGPKSALQILTQADIALLKEAVAKDDPVYLSKISGIGKKSAEKIVVGLKDKLELLGSYGNTEIVANAENAGAHTNDTIDALIALGYPPNDARKAVQQLPPEITNANDAVKAALKQLSSK